ncbi:MAG: hypothetical protein A4E25_01085 [Methanobacterium sp. PtaB.Bin024]|nr:MAG: hypothetical protein A4E25_01085 [Methanobacterium sp. PtaB.Bin024]
MVFCPNCGNENDDIAVYCSECGQKLQTIVDDQMETQGNVEKEILKEIILVSATKETLKIINKNNPKPKRDRRRSLYFTNKNIYIGQGTTLGNADMMGSIASSAGGVFGGVLGKKAGHSIAKQLSSSKRESIENNFQELAAQDPSIHIIPYTEIMNLFMNKQKTLRTSYITIETSADKYKFASLELKKYKQYLETIPTILGDKVIIEK